MDDKTKQKIETLLKKAEATPYEEEAAVYREHAEKLMIKYSIETHTLNLTAENETHDILHKTKTETNPYRTQKLMLLTAIAETFNCTVILLSGKPVGRYVIHGYKQDIKLAETLYDSLQQQMITAVLKEPVSTAAYRRTFMLGFVDVVKERLTKQHEEATNSSTELVLADVKTKVYIAAKNHHGGLKKQVRKYSGDGTTRGRKAGRKANLNANKAKITKKKN